jgi:hypothetical protein
MQILEKNNIKQNGFIFGFVVILLRSISQSISWRMTICVISFWLLDD